MAAKPDISDAWASSGSVTNPGSAKTILGWIAEIPTFQVFNWILNRIDSYLQHVNEQGVVSWDNATTFIEGAVVLGSDGNNYKLIPGAGTSLNEDPTSGSPWTRFVSGEANDWQSGQVINEDTVTYGASISVDVSVTQNANITLTGNMTITALNNPKTGGVYLLRLTQDGTAGRTVTWPANIRWPLGITPVLGIVGGDQDLVSLYYDGALFLANHSGAYAA